MRFLRVKSQSVDSEEKARSELLTVNMIVFTVSATVGISLHMHVHASTSTAHSHAIFQFMQQKQRTADPHTTNHIIIITMSRYTNH